MLLPISSDAPLYHYPIATVALIIVNVICYAVAGPAAPESIWMLHYGSFNPIEWVLSIFMHGSISHLVGNMFFLWAFGLIVEGKIGWRSFLFVYLSIGITQSGLEQMMMLFRTDAYVITNVLEFENKQELIDTLVAEDSELTEVEAEHIAGQIVSMMKGMSCGASAAIFGLLAICLVWAPKNEFNVILLLIFRFIPFDVTILWYSIWYIGWEVVMFGLGGFGIGSSALHLMGALIGFGVGVLYLKKDWVNCEKWDLFRVLAGNYGPHAEDATRVGNHADPTLMFGNSNVAVTDRDVPREAKKTTSKSNLLKTVNRLIDQNMMMEASEKMYSLQMRDSEAQLDEKRLKRLAMGLFDAAMLDEAEIYLEEYVERFPDNAMWARVRIAQVFLHQKRPSAAISMLKQTRLSELSAAMQKTAKQIAVAAKKQVRAGVEDAEPEW